MTPTTTEAAEPTTDLPDSKKSKKAKKKKKKSGWFYKITIMLLIAIMAFSAYKIITILYEYHVHLLLEIDPQYGVHKAVKQIKGYSSHILRIEFPWLKSRLPSLWTNSYFVSTVGGAPLAVIRQYIEDQKNV